MCETIFFVVDYSSVWPEICRVLSKIQWRFLRWISGKNYFGRIFQKFCANQAYPLPKFVKFRSTFCNFILGTYCAEKNHTIISYGLCPQVRRRVHKQITKRRYGAEKPTRFVFDTPVLFTLGLGQTTRYSLGVLIWKFYQTFVTVSIEFWQRFEPEIRPTWLTINFFIDHYHGWKECSFVSKTVRFFRGWIIIRLIWNLSCFVPNSVEILTWNFRKKVFQETFLEILCKPGLCSTKTCEISPHFLQIYFASVFPKVIYTSIFICCLHPGKETRL